MSSARVKAESLAEAAFRSARETREETESEIAGSVLREEDMGRGIPYD
jgi:predicted transcriptional regulator